jgi:energy-coupling factor transporter ATP-binding protein EcfA2
MTNSISDIRGPTSGSALPSRESNPFATCWTRPGALAFRFSNDESAERMIDRLAANKWSGEIVGPHGSGKSTLLETLKPLLAAAGRDLVAIALRDQQRRLPRGFLQRIRAISHPLVIVDGYEQLSRLSCCWLKWHCRRWSAGLLITAHAATGLPRLVRLQPDFKLVERLVTELTNDRPSPVTERDIAASHARFGSNVREQFFDLYDRHEVACRAIRTGPSSAA